MIKELDGNMEITETEYSKDGVIIKEITQDLDGKPLKSVTYDKYLDVIVYRQFKYNQEGRLVEEDIKYPNRSRNMHEIITYTYDENGECSSTKEFPNTESIKIEEKTAYESNILDKEGCKIGTKEHLMIRMGFAYKEVEYYDSLTQTTIYNKDKTVVLIKKCYYKDHLYQIEEIYPLEPSRNNKQEIKNFRIAQARNNIAYLEEQLSSIKNLGKTK